MNDIEAKEFVNSIFNQILKAQSIEDLIHIEEKAVDVKYRMDTSAYPKINFSISPTEIKELIQKGLLNSDYNITDDALNEIKDPLTKLLYAMAWKNGDLKKLKHIAKGIAEIDQKHIEQDEALVFYQFGRYLTKTEHQPIIDQHVLRSFTIYTSDDAEMIGQVRKLNTLTYKHKELINNYIEWLHSDEISVTLKAQKDYTYYIDRLLFAIGRKTKLAK